MQSYPFSWTDQMVACGILSCLLFVFFVHPKCVVQALRVFFLLVHRFLGGYAEFLLRRRLQCCLYLSLQNEEIQLVNEREEFYLSFALIFVLTAATNPLFLPLTALDL